MKRLVVVTQKVDETDDLLGFFVGWLREFALHFDRVDVITLGKGEYQLPDNVYIYSLGKERSSSKIFWLPKMKWLLLKYTRGASGVFCHMSPIFAVIAWPFARMFGAKLVLWYLHRSVTLKLRLALRMVDTLVTADEESLNIESPKIVATGHGIDIKRFSIPDRTFDMSDRPLHVLSVGRLAPIKDFGTLIEAAALLKERDVPVRVRIVGRALQPEHEREEKRLRKLVMERDVSDIVEFVGFVPYRDMPEQYRWADIVVGGTPKGGLDKAVLEGMAAGCVPLTSNMAMRETLKGYAADLLYDHGEDHDLADKLVSIRDREQLSVVMSERVREDHGLEGTVRDISQLLQ